MSAPLNESRSLVHRRKAHFPLMGNVRSFVGHETDLKLVMNRETEFNLNQIFLMSNSSKMTSYLKVKTDMELD